MDATNPMSSSVDQHDAAAISSAKWPGTTAAKWFSIEVQPHAGQLRAYLRSAFPRLSDVEDLVQESYLRVWRTRATQRVRSAKGLLFEIARRIAIDIVRRQAASPIAAMRGDLDVCVADDGPDSAEALLLEERKRLVIDAVASLPPRYREIIILRKFEEVPQKEVAIRLNLSERTVENLLCRGVRKCEAHLRRRGFGEYSRE